MRSKLWLLLIALPLCACTGSARAPRSPVAPSPGPLQATTAYVTQEVDGEEELVKVRGNAAELTRELGGLVLAEEQGRLHLRVPEAKLEAAMAALEQMAPIVHSRVHAPELTQVVSDLEIRVKGRRALRDRLLALLERADTVSEILEVERELSRVNEDLARAEAELAANASKVTFADLHLEIEDPASPGPIGWVFYGLYRGVKWLFVWD